MDIARAQSEPQLPVPPGNRQIYNGIARHPGDLIDCAIEIRQRKMLEHVRSDDDVELVFAEDRHIVDAAEKIRLERRVDIERCNVVSFPLEYLDVQSLTGPHYQESITGAKSGIPVLVVGVHEIRPVHLPGPR